MGRQHALAGSVAAAALLLAGAGSVLAQPARSDFRFLEASWCAAPHDDYKAGRYVVEILQFRQVKVTANPQTNAPTEVAAQLRSAMVATQTGKLEFVSSWIDLGFKTIDGLHLQDSSLSVTLSIAPERDRLIYKYADFKSYTYTRCGPATVELSEKTLLPTGIVISAPPAKQAATGAGPPVPAPAVQAPQRDVDARSDPGPRGFPDATLRLNRSYCFALVDAQGGFLGLLNQCTKAVNYTYCVLNPKTRHGSVVRCRAAQGEQIGQGGGSVQPGQTGYLGLPVDEKGRVVWFACEFPGTPALTSADPPAGQCR
ncbi:MAG TPA: hypothetical protein VFB20_03575 [Burkholderiales bacterium]|nr:hypothetical protein [Burkholderiales bacterium]